jgi:hypothetical protein
MYSPGADRVAGRLLIFFSRHARAGGHPVRRSLSVNRDRFGILDRRLRAAMIEDSSVTAVTPL